VNLKKNKSQGKAVEVTLNSTEENSSEDFCMDLVQELGLRTQWTCFLTVYFLLNFYSSGLTNDQFSVCGNHLGIYSCMFTTQKPNS
jgi:hypothetical protein